MEEFQVPTRSKIEFHQEHNLALVSLFYRLIVEAEYSADQSVTITQEDSRCYPRFATQSTEKWPFEYRTVIMQANTFEQLFC